MNKIKWIFFDVGSTLIDETECYNHRIKDAIAGTDITFEQFNEKRIFFAKQNLKGDIEALKFFGLKKTPWHFEDERPYEKAEAILNALCERGYSIGIIANQALGTEQRLKNNPRRASRGGDFLCLPRSCESAPAARAVRALALVGAYTPARTAASRANTPARTDICPNPRG